MMVGERIEFSVRVYLPSTQNIVSLLASSNLLSNVRIDARVPDSPKQDADWLAERPDFNLALDDVTYDKRAEATEALAARVARIDKRFEGLSHISVSHLYNLRGTRVYQSRSLTYTKTPTTSRDIGIRKRPAPDGKPGFLRVDSVHQGDLDKQKGVYHINLVDEVTQDEIVVTVEGISEEFLRPALEEALATFPFRILGFHSDNGSEYLNKRVALLLSKLLIEQTKSRSRRTNDNALVEGKNGAVVRKHFGYMHIPRKYASLMNEFNRAYLNPYLFFHRQCAFADEIADDKGKIKKVYKTYLTPCEKLLSIPDVEKYLNPGITKESLHARAMEQTHLAAAKKMQEAKKQLFAEIHRRMLR